MFQRIKSVVLDTLFPASCVGEGDHGWFVPEGSYICEQCSLFISETALICPVCQQSSFTGERHGSFETGTNNNPQHQRNCVTMHGLNGLVSVWEYEGVVRKLLTLIKYHNLTHPAQEIIARAFSVMAKDQSRYEAFLSFLFQKDTIITHVPMIKRKERRRGYNQAKLFAKALGAIAHHETLPFLKKIRDTKSQTELNKMERLENVRGSFGVENGVLPERVVLVDDVWTTGATMKECCKTLKKAGVKQVWGFTIAKTP